VAWCLRHGRARRDHRRWCHRGRRRRRDQRRTCQRIVGGVPARLIRTTGFDASCRVRQPSP
jgi:hypothetical protein